MKWLNYHHLRCFWAVAREGSLRKASEKLRVSEPSISTQIQALRQSLGEDLFRRSGRGLALTEMGRLVYGYAQEIFSLGEELLHAVSGMPANRGLKLDIGLADSMPKLVANEILKPVFSHTTPTHVVCREGRVEDLLAQLATLRLDIVLADEPASTGVKFKTFSHFLGACSVSFCAAPPRSCPPKTPTCAAHWNSGSGPSASAPASWANLRTQPCASSSPPMAAVSSPWPPW